MEALEVSHFANGFIAAVGAYAAVWVNIKFILHRQRKNEEVLEDHGKRITKLEIQQGKTV